MRRKQDLFKDIAAGAVRHICSRRYSRIGKNVDIDHREVSVIKKMPDEMGADEA